VSVTRHPWNTTFRWQPGCDDPTTLTREQCAQFDRDGFVVIRDALPVDAIAHVRSEIDAFERTVDEFLRTRDDERLFIAEAGAITFTTHIVAKSEAMKAFATHDLFVGLARDLIGPDVNMYWDQAVYKKPEKPRRFPWHQDNGYTFVEPQQYLTCWVPLTAATVDNGCPWVAPGLHTYGTLAHHYVDPLGWECLDGAPPNACAAPVAPGDIVVFSSLTPHMTGPNLTDDVRKAYILQYAPAGARIQMGNPDTGPPTGEQTCDAPDRQFAILRGGQRV